MTVQPGTRQMDHAEYVAEIDRLVQAGRTDGLPVMVPNAEGVAAMVAASGRAAEEVLGSFERPVSVADVAEQAFMAGCRPEYMPVVLAAFEILLDPAMAGVAFARSDLGFVPFVVVNGPVRTRIGVNAGRNVFGPGFRANATIGRAIRLGLIDLAGATPATIGNAYQYTCVIAEDEEQVPWSPLHTDLGFAREDSTVFVAWTRPPVDSGTLLTGHMEHLAYMHADALTKTLTFDRAGVPSGGGLPKALAVLGFDQWRFMREQGWTKRSVQERIQRNARLRVGDARALGRGIDPRIPADAPDTAMVPLYGAPEDILVVGAGAGGGVGQSKLAEVLRFGIRKVREPAAGAVAATPRVEAELSSAAQVAAVDKYFERGFTDGWPIVPPTPRMVEEMIAASGRKPDDVAGTFNWRTAPLLVKEIALNALLAGCKPAYMPVVLAIFDSLLAPGSMVSGWGASVGGFAPWVIVNGPIRKTLGLNSGSGVLGPGSHANATIGRSIRLVLMNLGGVKPDVVDRSGQGQPYKYTCCIAENEEDSPWRPLHTELGFQASDSVVTVTRGVTDPRQTTIASDDPETILRAIAEDDVSLRGFSGISVDLTDASKNQPYKPQGGLLVLLGGDHRRALAAAGWDKRRIQEFLAEHSVYPLGKIRASGNAYPGRFPDDAPDDTMIRTIGSPDEVVILAAGGSGPHTVTVRAGRSSLWPRKLAV